MKVLAGESCGYEMALVYCEDDCQTCLTMAHETAYSAARDDARKAVQFLYLTGDDNVVKCHEVFVTRLYKVDLSKEPF